LPRTEIEALAVGGVVEITCEFCNKSYKFDEKRRKEIYKQ
jgi:redox-regulated HSP33 family molecular chaperone